MTRTPDDFEGQRDLLLAARSLMRQAARYCRHEEQMYSDEFPDRAREYAQYAVENDAAADRLYAVAMTYDLPLWDVE